jgi:hypothetical protein
MKKLVITTLLLLGLLGGLLFSLTTASADPCQILGAEQGDATNVEIKSDDQVGQCNASVVIAYQEATATATSETTAVAEGDYSTAEATSDTDATAYNTISVTQSNTAGDIFQFQD